MFRWLFPAVALALITLSDARSAWGPAGCSAQPAAVAANTRQLNGWYESVQFPGWQVKYINGHAYEWFQPSTGKYQVWDGYQWTSRKPPREWAVREVDTAAVYRLGDSVQHIDGKHQAESGGWMDTLTQIPVNDSGKWHISVIGTQGCAPCATLKRDWATSPELLAFAVPNDPGKSWGHYVYYDAGDESQSWRFASIRIVGYPTVIVQPPRDGSRGEPDTVVFQRVYDGRPKALAKEMSAAIRKYCEKQPKRVYYPPYDASAPPPIQPPPKIDPVGPGPIGPVNPEQIPPPDGPASWLPCWHTLRWYIVGAAAIGVVVLILIGLGQTSAKPAAAVASSPAAKPSPTAAPSSSAAGPAPVVVPAEHPLVAATNQWEGAKADLAAAQTHVSSQEQVAAARLPKTTQVATPPKAA